MHNCISLMLNFLIATCRLAIVLVNDDHDRSKDTDTIC